MAIDVSLLNSNSLDNITTNFTRVEAALQEAVSTAGTVPNSMGADLDMDSNDILNANVGYFNAVNIDGVAITSSVTGIPSGDKGDITVSGGGVWTINANAVDSDNIADNAVGNTEIADGAVTLAKLAPALVQTSVEGTAPTDDTVLPTNKLVADMIGAIVFPVGSSVTAAATITALKAVDTSDYNGVLVLESGKDGWFVWASGDYSAEVAADTSEAIYVKATAIAATVGVWVRRDTAQGFNVKWWGAKGDGTTNDTTAFTNAMAYIQANWWATGSPENVVAQLNIPAGLFIIDGDAELELSDYLRIKGQGHGVTILKATAVAGTMFTRPFSEADANNERSTHIEILDIRFVLTAANQVALNVAHSGRGNIRGCMFTRQTHGDEQGNLNQSVLSGTIAIKINTNTVRQIGGDVFNIEGNYIYWMGRGIQSGLGTVNNPGPEALRIVNNEISDCTLPIVVNSYGGARGVIRDNVIQRWGSGTSRAIDVVGRRWFISNIYLESTGNTVPPILIRTGSVGVHVDTRTCINYTDTDTGGTVGCGPSTDFVTNDGTSSVVE